MGQHFPNVEPREEPQAITPSLWWVGRSGWGGHPILTTVDDCNIYLLKGDKFDVLIDSGGHPTLAKLERNLRRVGSSPKRVREIWLTHSHFDHFLGAGVWSKKYPATICRLSKLGIARLRQQDFRLIGSFHPPRPAHYHLPKRLLPLASGSVLSCPPYKFTVEETPGHTPDCLCFRGEVDGLDVLVSGDTVIGDQPCPGHGIQKGGIGWIDGYWGSDLRDFRKSVARLQKKPADLMLPGHGKPHAGKAVQSSLKNSLARIDRLMASPDVMNMGPYYSFAD